MLFNESVRMAKMNRSGGYVRGARLLWQVMLVGIVTLACLCVGGTAFAQDEKPLPFTIDVVDVSPKDTSGVLPVVRDLLGRAGGLDHQSGVFLQANDGFDITVFETADARASNKKIIGKALRDGGIELLLVVNLYESGDELEIIMIGPDGAELDVSKHALSENSTLSEKEGMLALREALTSGIPAAQAYRENPPPIEDEPEEVASTDDAGDDDFGDDDFGDDDFGDDDFGDDDGFGDSGFGEEDTGWGDGKGVLPTKVAVGAGVFFGRRDFQLTTDALEINQFNPIVGTAAHFRFAYGLLEDAMQVGVDADFAYAPFGSAYVPPGGGEQESLDANFVRGGGVARAAYAIWPFLAVGAHAGVDVLSITVDQNATYTGHRYIWARAGAEVSVIPVEGFVFTIEGNVLPVFSALTSGDAYGIGQGGLGSEFAFTADAKLTDRFSLRGQYRFTQIGVSEYNDATQGQGTPSSGDRVDAGMLAVSVTF